MDQHQQSSSSEEEALIITTTTKKLSAKAPEFVPRSSSAPPLPLLRPPVFIRPPPPFYGFDNNNFYPQNVSPPHFYPSSSSYNINNNNNNNITTLRVSNSDFAPPAAAVKNGISDSHRKIINQVEFYFSDINLATTEQLFRSMTQDPQGYVPLSVVASFKKIKSAISDIVQLASILRTSNKLLVNEDGNKVKRQDPLTESDMEELQSRIVIAENLPEDHTHQNLMKVFSSVGSVKSIRTCQPQNSSNGASSASRTGKGDAMHISSKFHAFVEYESMEVAEKAVAELNEEGNWRNGLKVRLLLKNAIKSSQVRGKKVGPEGQPTGKKDEGVVPEMQHVKNNYSEDSFQQSDAQNHELQFEDNAKSNAERKGRNYTGGNGNGRAKGKGKGKGHGRGRPQYPILGSPPSPTEVSQSNNNSKTSSSVPRMPDGTKGFSIGRGKTV